MEITFWLNVGVRYKKVPPPPPLNQINIILKICWLHDVRIHFTLILLKNQNISCKK